MNDFEVMQKMSAGKDALYYSSNELYDLWNECRLAAKK